MAKSAGRYFLLKLGGATIAAVRSKGVTWNGTPIDTTTDDDDGATSYLADEFGTTALEISVEGLADGDELAGLAFTPAAADKHMTDLTLERANGDVIAGTFVLTNYAENGSHNEATAFTATLVRNGAHAWTPSA